MPTLDFVAMASVLYAFRQTRFRGAYAISTPKNLQKTYPKPCPNHEKIDAKNDVKKELI